MSMLRELRISATDAALSRGHTVLWDAPNYWGGTPIRATQVGHCPVCKKEVHIETHPAPNGIEIGGWLVATNCHG